VCQGDQSSDRRRRRSSRAAMSSRPRFHRSRQVVPKVAANPRDEQPRRRLPATERDNEPKAIAFLWHRPSFISSTPGVVPGRHVDACSHVHVDLVYFAERLRI
jgi:hypothetical protein